MRRRLVRTLVFASLVGTAMAVATPVAGADTTTETSWGSGTATECVTTMTIYRATSSREGTSAAVSCTVDVTSISGTISLWRNLSNPHMLAYSKESTGDNPANNKYFSVGAACSQTTAAYWGVLNVCAVSSVNGAKCWTAQSDIVYRGGCG